MTRAVAVVLAVLIPTACKSTCPAPTVSFRNPMNGQTVGGTVAVQLDVTSSCDISSVALTANGSSIATLTSAPYSTFWDTSMLADGSSELTATATNVDGATGKASISVLTSQPCVTGQPCPPQVSIVTPVASATVCGQVTIYADVTTQSGTPSVSFLADGQSIGPTQTTGPYLQDWDTSSLSAGAHAIEVQATDASGLMGASTLDVSVTAPGKCTAQGPVVAFACPAPNAQGHLQCAGGELTLCADVDDSATITSVSYGLGGQPLSGSTPSGPQWTTMWNTAMTADGIYQLQANATDASGLTGKTTLSLQIDNTPPTVSITQPSTGATIAAGTSVTLDVSASDGTGCGVAQVVYAITGAGTATLTATSTPFSQTWDTTGDAAGAYTITATATDGAGLTATTAVMVTLTAG